MKASNGNFSDADIKKSLNPQLYSYPEEWVMAVRRLWMQFDPMGAIDKDNFEIWDEDDIYLEGIIQILWKPGVSSARLRTYIFDETVCQHLKKQIQPRELDLFISQLLDLNHTLESR